MPRLRPPRRDEAEAVHAVILARDVADMGRPDYSVRDVRDDWEMPGPDLGVASSSWRTRTSR